ncbi:MAG: MFS transporter [Rhodobacteraceae bacterium]|nr:MFS transporter [Paracoccaceae bacterium]
MTEHDSPYSFFRLAIGLLIATLGNVGIWIFVLVMPAIQKEFGIDRALASIPYVTVMVGFAFGNMYMGRLADRHGISKTLIISAIINASAFGLAMLSPSILFLSTIHFFIGVAAAANFGPLMADISHWFFKRRGIAVGITASGNYISGAIWPFILSNTLETDGWRTVYAIVAVITVIVMVPLSLLLHRKISEEAFQKSDVASEKMRKKMDLPSGKLIILLSIAGVACCVAMAMPQVHIVALCVDLGYGPTIGGEMLSLMLLGGIVSRILSGSVADRIGGTLTLLIGSILQCLALLLYLPSDALVSLYLVSLVFGLSQGGIVPSYAIIIREYLPSEVAGEKIGNVLMMTILGMALGGWLSGWIYDLTGSYTIALANGIAWNIINLSIAVLLLIRDRGFRLNRTAIF